jgi:hypothetical protein
MSIQEIPKTLKEELGNIVGTYEVTGSTAKFYSVEVL